MDGCAPGPAAAECDPRPSYVVAGEVVLGEDGTATRTMDYDIPGDVTAGIVTSRGTYVLRFDDVRFALVQDGDPLGYVWRPGAVLVDDRLTFRYPHPADGETVEVFVRR